MTHLASVILSSFSLQPKLLQCAVILGVSLKVGQKLVQRLVLNVFGQWLRLRLWRLDRLREHSHTDKSERSRVPGEVLEATDLWREDALGTQNVVPLCWSDDGNVAVNCFVLMLVVSLQASREEKEPLEWLRHLCLRWGPA